MALKRERWSCWEMEAMGCRVPHSGPQFCHPLVLRPVYPWASVSQADSGPASQDDWRFRGRSGPGAAVTAILEIKPLGA